MMSSSTPFVPFVTVVMPCRNEEKYIRTVLEQLLRQDHPKDRLEILVVDGMSEDATVTIVEEMSKDWSGTVRSLKNPEKTVPYALNRAISEARGDFIVRVDAHSEYPEHYIRTLIEKAEELGADNIGAAWDTVPGSSRVWARSIAAVTSHPLGIGDAEYRSRQEGGAIETDTVPFGCYRRDVFKWIGLFDVELTRNQDDEFNARLIQEGGRIFLLPLLRITYYGRSSLSEMFSQFFQYGYFKPLVNKKLRKPATLRQFAPPLLVLFISLILILLPFWVEIFYLLIAGLFLYLLAGMKVFIDRKEKLNALSGSIVPVVLFLLHFAYGVGYWGGMSRWAFHNGEHKEGNA
jgi:glycosyltransferase involved in cell wall biosynthesis